MFVLGVTGGIGSGKTAATDQFEKLGIEVVDADIMARVVVEPGRPALAEIEKHFGLDVICEDGTLNRAALRKRVFESAEERLWLEKLTHPLIRDEILSRLRNASSPYVILASPLLIESGQYHLVQRVLVIDAPRELQLQRAMARDTNSESQINAILDAQLSREDRLKYADDVICNDQSLDHLVASIESLHPTYLELAKS